MLEVKKTPVIRDQIYSISEIGSKRSQAKGKVKSATIVRAGKILLILLK